MLIPYKDINPTRRFAVITFLIIIINIVMFLFQLFSDSGFVNTSRQLAVIPVELYKGNLPNSKWISPFTSVITYMFIHGGFFHIVFNMMFLWIFGNNIEDKMSRIRFPVFYLIVGIISGLAFAISNPGSQRYLLGASGAISGILGAYLCLFPMARVKVLLFIFPIIVPAFLFLIVWFVLQISGFMDGQGNIAWVTHISGFVAGVLLHRLFLKRL